MKLFEGKTKSERNKTIAAIILGGACLIVLFYAFGGSIFSGAKTTATAKPSPTPRTTTSGRSNPGAPVMPSVDDQNLVMMSQPVVYNPDRFIAANSGRNIFAFYEPPKPTPWVPTPEQFKPTPPPTPAPTPPIQLAMVNPGSVYAGSNGFRLDVTGDRFTPDTKIYFEQMELPSTFINEQRMTADIPSVLIRDAGGKTVVARSADGTMFSNPVRFDVQPPPKPQFQYIGMIARARGNNDTAYFQESGKPPTTARLNDVVAGRFRLVSISAAETVLEDVNLGFKHRLALREPPAPVPGAAGQPTGPVRGFPAGGRQPESYTPVNPPAVTNTRIPGIPDNIPRYQPPASNSNREPATRKPRQNDDDGDDDDGR